MHAHVPSRSWAQKGLFIVAGFCLGGLAACATDSRSASLAARQAMIGKSEADVIACAGQPVKRVVTDAGVQLVYRNEPDVLERSFPMAKGSITCPHHRCDASVLLHEGKVVDVEFHPSPAGSGACDHCDRIFINCGP